jgi:hypothetical protein
MKRLICVLSALLLAPPLSPAAEPETPVISALTLEGTIDGENIVFELAFTFEGPRHPSALPLVVGDVAYLDGTFPRQMQLRREGNAYLLTLPDGRLPRGPQAVKMRFASRPVKDGDWRRTQFSVPVATIRQLAVVCDRDDLELRFPGALNVVRSRTAEDHTRVSAFLGTGSDFQVQWKPEVRKLDSELVISADANTLATANIGAMRFDTVFSYRVIQGAIKTLSLELPDINVIQVTGKDIQDWRIQDATGTAPAQLIVVLSRPQPKAYQLRVTSELPLPKFPCKSLLPVIQPREVIRASGFLMLGTDSAIKLQIARAAGLTQIDPAAFPVIDMPVPEGGGLTRARPARSVYAYQYAGTPYALEFKADDIVTTFTADNTLVVSLADDELTMRAAVAIDIKDAPARELELELDPDSAWTVTGVTGAQVAEADVDVRHADGRRTLYVPFMAALHGPALIHVEMQKSLGGGSTSFAVPRIAVVGAKSERGYLVLAAEKGIRLRPASLTGLREVHTASAPLRVDGAQQAYRYKTPDWALSMTVDRTVAALHSEVFHLVSLGEGVMYCSAAITYHISGAPLQEFVVHVPAAVENVEFTGADIEGWRREGDRCTVRLQTRIMGDYTLLATYDRQFDYEGAVIAVGGIELVGVKSEVGYIAVASSASLRLTEQTPPPQSIIPIDRDEVPVAYASPVDDPIVKAYKYVKAPHTIALRVEPFATQRLLGQIADYVAVKSAITRKGGVVTTVTYYLKNASRQYLVAQLPEAATLWTIKHVDADGRKVDALSQMNGRDVLIPVSRPRDPNSPIVVELTYAESHRALGALRSGLRPLALALPVLPESNASFVRWQISVPDGFVLANARGTVVPEATFAAPGFAAVLRACARLPRAALRRDASLLHAWRTDFGGRRELTLTQTVNLASADPLGVRLRIVPDWIGAESAVLPATLALLVGLAALSIWPWVRRPVVPALAVTALAYSAGNFAVGRSALAVVVWLAIATGLGLFLVKWGFRAVWWCMRRGFGLSAAAVRWGRRTSARGVSLAAGLWSAHRTRRAAERDARREAASLPPDLEPFAPLADAPDTRDGRASLGLLLVLTALLPVAAAVSAALPAGSPPPPPLPPPAPTMDCVEIAILGPRTQPDAELSARVELTFSFTASGAADFPVVPPGGVLIDRALGAAALALRASPAGYSLVVAEKGAYRVALTYRLPVIEREGHRLLSVPVLPNMRNKIRLKVPEADTDIDAAGAVLFRTFALQEATLADCVFGPVATADFSWRPRMRTTKLEEAVFFTEVNSFAGLQSGVMDLLSRIQYRIAQGELRELRVRIPEGMSVTAVRAPQLATWNFDPRTRLLEAILSSPVSGMFALEINTQMACEGLPYDLAFGLPQVLGTARQRGAVAIAAPDSVQVRIEDAELLNPMNVEDFSAATRPAAPTGGRSQPMTVRRAFRYHDPERARVSLHAEEVLPETRVVEQGALSIADERIVLVTKLTLTIAKAGIFATRIRVPADFDVETLSGPDVSHWDELEVKPEGRLIAIHFNRLVADETVLNLVVACMEKGIDPDVTVPRVTVLDCRKHTGRLTLAGERGVRMMVADHQGVDIKKASEVGIRQAGVLVFDILRPTWSMTLRTEIMAPLVKPEVLQWVDLSEGMLQCRAYLRYKIENAGVKSFFLKSPAPGVTLSVTGRNVARVHSSDETNGVWQVDLHGKAEDQFSMVASYQIPFNHQDRAVRILPLQTLGTEGQRGYLVVTCGGRVQVAAAGDPAGLKAEDPRNIPTVFGAGDLSGAVLCYRAVRADYALPLSVVRHESAAVLPASVQQVQLTSVVSSTGRLLTRVQLGLSVGDLRFLKVELPRADDALWTVLVDGKEVAVSRDRGRYCIPLEEQAVGQTSRVEFIYAGGAADARLGQEWTFLAPRLADLPLNNVTWDFHVPPGSRYSGFGGSMEHDRHMAALVQSFETEDYRRWNLERRAKSIATARDVLDAGEAMARSGQQRQAKQKFQQALNFSVGQADLNEDARVQLRNLTKQQVKMGLVNRREALRFRNNIIDDSAAGPVAGFQNGEFTPEYARSVAQQLTDKDNRALETVADKIIEQQAAAAGVVTAISVTMPEHGKILRFHRQLQIDPAGELSVVFRARSGHLLSTLSRLVAPLVLFLALWAGFALRRGRRRLPA